MHDSFSTEEQERYSRHFMLPEVGEEGQAKLKNSSVLCIGSGGLGSPAIMYLAAAGVGTLGIIDPDTVDTSNLQRQVLHSDASVGSPKVESAKKRVHEINPHIQVNCYQERFTPENALSIAKDYDIIVDGSDNFPTRYLSNDVAYFLKIPNVPT